MRFGVRGSLTPISLTPISIPTALGPLAFDARYQRQHAGLLLTGRHHQKRLAIAFGAGTPEGGILFHGWLMQYKASTLRLERDFNTTPNRREKSEGGGIWQGGAGLAADSHGSIYFTTGNGDNDPGSFGNSIIKLTPARRWCRRFFRAAVFDAKLDDDPANAMYWQKSDIDLGSGGVTVIPGANRVIGGGKTGVLYLLDSGASASLPKVQSFEAFSSAYEIDPAMIKQLRYGNWYGGPHLHGAPTHWRSDQDTSYIYHWGETDYLKRFTYRWATGMIDLTATMKGPIKADNCFGAPPGIPCPMPGGMISLSANRASNGIVWATLPVETSDGKGRDFAFDALTLAKLWETLVPKVAHWIPPTIADGKVIVATGCNEFRVYDISSTAVADPVGQQCPPAPSPHRAPSHVR